jgi:hypothetical protein
MFTFDSELWHEMPRGRPPQRIVLRDTGNSRKTRRGLSSESVTRVQRSATHDARGQKTGAIGNEQEIGCDAPLASHHLLSRKQKTRTANSGARSSKP